MWYFAENSVFAAFDGLFVTHLVAHRFTLGNPILAITIIYLLRVTLSMDVYYVKIKFMLVVIYLFFLVKIILKIYLCKVCDKLHAWV